MRLPASASRRPCYSANPRTSARSRPSRDSAFELGFVGDLNVLTRAAAAEVEALLDAGLLEIEKTFRFLTGQPESKNPFPTGTVSAQTRAEIANFQSALDRLQGASPIINIFG